MYKIILATVGQFTGIHDIYDQEVFEGDIIEITIDCKNWYREKILKYTAIVEYNEDSLTFIAKSENMEFNGCGFSYLSALVRQKIRFVVIGRLHDNI